MKKFFLIVVIFLMLQITMQLSCFAETSIDFIYINGSNNNNEKMHKWFINGINKFHPTLKKQLEKDEYTYEYLLKNGKYKIEESPSTFFWGYKSKTDLMFMKEKANQLRSISPVVAFCVRNAIADIMHDAIWVQKTHNMIPIIQDLDKQIKEDVKQNKKVVLLGYSAGSFITMEYLFSKIPCIDISQFFKDENISYRLKDMISKNPRKNTCLMAFVGSNLTNITPLNEVIINKNEKEFMDAYMSMDSFTEKYCIPDDTVIGVINYASPIPLFYSDMGDEKFGTSKYNFLMYKYLIEHDFFFLTVNYADDPLGFPNGVNYINDEIEDMANLEFENELGFFYDYSKALSWRTFAGAHTSYWSTKKHFSKAIVKAYTEGRKLQYDKEYQEKAKKSLLNTHKTK